MRAFKVSVNGKKVCVAGIGENGVLTAIVNWVTGDRASDLFLEVGGLVTPVREHVAWASQKPLRVGDEVRIRIVEAASVDTPVKKHLSDPAKELSSKKRYVRVMAKQLGWTIRTRPKKRTS